MSQLRRLIFVALASGTLAGLVWFGLQYYTVIPLIATAEVYETAAHDSAHNSSQPHDHDEGWRPANGWQRNSYTALATVLTSIGYASMLFGLISLWGRRSGCTAGSSVGISGVCLLRTGAGTRASAAAARGCCRGFRRPPTLVGRYGSGDRYGLVPGC